MTYKEKSAIIIKQLRADRDRLADAIDKIRDEINKSIIRNEYSQRQNGYCDGYEFVCNRIKEIIDDVESEE